MKEALAWAGGAVGLIVKVVYDLVAPGLAAVPGNAHDGIQVLGGVGGVVCQRMSAAATSQPLSSVIREGMR